jgi:hypothetical protein
VGGKKRALLFDSFPPRLLFLAASPIPSIPPLPSSVSHPIRQASACSLFPSLLPTPPSSLAAQGFDPVRRLGGHTWPRRCATASSRRRAPGTWAWAWPPGSGRRGGARGVRADWWLQHQELLLRRQDGHDGQEGQAPASDPRSGAGTGSFVTRIPPLLALSSLILGVPLVISFCLLFLSY